MEKNKVLLTDKVTKENIKSPTFKKWVMRVLCFACILSLALQFATCVAPMHASAEESIVGTWVLNEVPTYTGDQMHFSLSGTFNYYNGTDYATGNLDLITLNSPDSYVNYGWTVLYREIGSYPAQQTGCFTNTLSSNFSNRWSCVYWTTSTQSTSYNINLDDTLLLRTITITSEATSNNDVLLAWLKANATKVVETVYDFSGEYRLFNEQLTNLSFSQSGTVTQSYAFDFNIWGGYNADYFHVQSDGSYVDISYSFTDDGSGGIKTVYRQLLRDGEIVGTWLVPRARLIYFQSNPDDPTFQQWLLDNTVLIDETMIQAVYNFGYDNGFNDGWTNSAIGDTFKAPIDALNGMVLLQTADVTITLGGVIFTMVVLSLLIVFLKKYAGG